jgi:DNA-binding XRE family transcriptional regulator
MATKSDLSSDKLMMTKQPRQFHLKEWRKFKGVKAVDLAEALEIQRESYYRLEKKWWTISVREIDVLAKKIGIEPGEFWLHPERDRASTDIDLALKFIAAIRR